MNTWEEVAKILLFIAAASSGVGVTCIAVSIVLDVLFKPEALRNSDLPKKLFKIGSKSFAIFGASALAFMVLGFLCEGRCPGF